MWSTRGRSIFWSAFYFARGVQIKKRILNLMS